MLAKRHIRFVLSIQVFPAQLELHKDLLFLDFYTFGSFYNGVYTNCNKNKICERGIFLIFFLGKMVHRFCPTPSFLLKRTAAPHLDQSSAHLRQQESTIFWSFSRSWYTLRHAVAWNLRREGKTTHSAVTVDGKTTGWSSVKAAVRVL